MSNLKKSTPQINLSNQISTKTKLTQEQIRELIVQSQKKRFPAPAPQPLTQAERLKQYNSVLSKLDRSKIIRIIPNTAITLTPCSPRSADGRGSIGLVT